MVASRKPKQVSPSPRASDEVQTTAPSHPRCATLTVEEAGEMLGLSRGLAYDAVGKGEIPSVRIGRRILIPRVALDRLLESAGKSVQ